ncbi:MAG TPA: ABC transporter permease [Vicinamibacterales bacterium]|nr:ABC transporter permease [Vicinamibacterales bacterium]
MTTNHPLKELTIARIREFLREPEAVFWTYGFPLMLAVGLGIAFRDRPVELAHVDVQAHAQAADIAARLASRDDLVVAVRGEAECRDRLRLGKSSLVVVPGDPVTFVFDPSRPESALARERVNDVLQRAAGRQDPVRTSDTRVTEPGARYIDFLIPGLLGMNLMGGSLWGVGFVIVDMRVKKLLKRLAATPMARPDFLWSIAGSRLLFMIPELVVILGAGVLLFGMPVRGSWLAILTLALLGAGAFAGLGMLVACRAQRIETVSGLMNAVMVPMWLLSGIFFSSERFPDLLQPLVQALPLTQLNDALRAVILEGASLASQAWRVLALAAWGAVSFVLALRWFRWM